MSDDYDGSVQHTVQNHNIHGLHNQIDFSDDKSHMNLTQKKQMSQQECATAQKVDIVSHLMTKDDLKFNSNIKILCKNGDCRIKILDRREVSKRNESING